MINIEHLTKTYSRGSKTVIKDMTYQFPKRGFFAITGESGCGKTTLLYVISGLTSFFGHVSFSGYGEDLETARRENIGFVFQDFRLPESSTVKEAVMEGCVAAGIPEKESRRLVRRALDAVQLSAVEEKRCSALSEGQKQRVSIARAIAKGAHVILADEPTGNLDKENAENVLEILRQISKRRLVIMVTHQIDLAKNYVDAQLRLEMNGLKPINPQSNEEAASEKASANGECHLLETSYEGPRAKGHRWRIFKSQTIHLSKRKATTLPIAVSCFALFASFSIANHKYNESPKLKAGIYSNTTLSLSSNADPFINREEILKFFLDPKSMADDPCFLSIAEGSSPIFSIKNLPFVQYNIHEPTEEKNQAIYFLDAEKYEGCGWFDFDSMPQKACVIDQKIIDRFSSNYNVLNPIGSTIQLQESQTDGSFAISDLPIHSICDTGCPFVFVKGYDADELNYAYRGDHSQRFDKAKDITLLDANRLPSGFSIGSLPEISEGKPIVFMNESARKFLSRQDLSFLGIDVQSGGVLHCIQNDKPIIALFDKEENGSIAVKSKADFAQLVLKASIDKRCVLSKTKASLTEGEMPSKAGEYLLSKTLVDMAGGLDSINTACSSIGAKVTGSFDGQWQLVYGCGREEWVTSQITIPNYATRYANENARVTGSPRLLSRNFEETNKWMNRNLGTRFILSNVDHDVNECNKDIALEHSQIEWIVFGIMLLVATLAASASSASYGASSWYDSGLSRCLGFSKSDIFIGKVSAMTLYLFCLVIGTLCSAIAFFGFFGVAINPIIVVIGFSIQILSTLIYACLMAIGLTPNRRQTRK